MLYRILILSVIALSGCASSPYVELRMENQINPWSDWVLQPERDWTPAESEARLNMQVGLEWDNGVDCFGDVILSGPWDQMFLGCSKSFRKPLAEKLWLHGNVGLMHQVDGRTSQFLKTDEKQWQGHNPFIHVRVGVDYAGMKCNIATGKSLFQGAPFEKEAGNPDLYWTNIGCGVRFFGKTGAWQR